MRRLRAALHWYLNHPVGTVELFATPAVIALLIGGGIVGRHAWQTAHAAPPPPPPPQHRIVLEVFGSRGMSPQVECALTPGCTLPGPPQVDEVSPIIPMTGSVIVSSPAGFQPLDVTLPWSESLTGPAGDVDLQARVPEAGTLTCRITVDGLQVAQQDGSSNVECRAPVF